MMFDHGSGALTFLTNDGPPTLPAGEDLRQVAAQFLRRSDLRHRTAAGV